MLCASLLPTTCYLSSLLKAFTAAIMVTGSLFSAYMVSQLSVFLSQINASHREYRHRMDAVHIHACVASSE